MLEGFVYAAITLIVISAIAFLYEVKHSITVDPKEPFLHDDFKG
jgi:hypothetical protein